MVIEKRQLYILIGGIVIVIVLLFFLFQSKAKSSNYQELIAAKQEVIESLKRERSVYEQLQQKNDSLIDTYMASAENYRTLYENNLINHANNQRRYNEIPKDVARLGRNTDSIRRAFSDF